MPCYEPREHSETSIIYQTGISPDALLAERDRANKMEAVVCALMNEIDRRGIAESVIANASRNGLIDITSIWRHHKNNDFSRIADELHKKYSKDEQDILRTLLNSGV